MRVEKYLVLVCASKLTWFLCGGIEIDLTLEWRSNCLGFSSGVEINVFLYDRILLVFGVGLEIDLFLPGGSKLTLCGPKLLVLSVIFD